MELSSGAFTSIFALLFISCVVKAQPCSLPPNLQKLYDRNSSDYSDLYCFLNPINPILGDFVEFVAEQAIETDPADYLVSTCLPPMYDNFRTLLPPPIGTELFNSCPPTAFPTLDTEAYPLMKRINDDGTQERLTFWYVADFDSPLCMDFSTCSKELLNEFLGRIVLAANTIFYGGGFATGWTILDHFTPPRQCLESIAVSLNDTSLSCNDPMLVDVVLDNEEEPFELEVCKDGCTPETISDEDILTILEFLVGSDLGIYDEGLPLDVALPTDANVKVTKKASAVPSLMPSNLPSQNPTLTPTVNPTPKFQTPFQTPTKPPSGKKGKKDNRKSQKTKGPK